MVKTKVISVVGFIFVHVCSSFVMAAGISENLKGNSKPCLSSEELFEAATRADCVDGDVFGSCWIVGSHSLNRGVLIGSAVASVGIAITGDKAVKKSQKFAEEQGKVYGVQLSPNNSKMEQVVVQFDHLNDRNASKAKYEDNSRKYFETMKSLGVSEGEIASLLGIQNQYYLSLLRIAEHKDMINDPRTPATQKEHLKKSLESLEKK